MPVFCSFYLFFFIGCYKLFKVSIGYNNAKRYLYIIFNGYAHTKHPAGAGNGYAPIKQAEPVALPLKAGNTC